MREALFLRLNMDKNVSEKNAGESRLKRAEKLLRKKLKWMLALVLLAGCICGSYTLSRYVAGTKVEKEEVQVILDAGHGGSDPGKVGIDNVLEKDLNLQIALKVKKYLEKEKIAVMLTRETDTGLGNAETGNKKVEDMKARVEMINQIQPDIAVSIHQNSYQDPEVRGAQVFYYSHSESGEELAKIMQEVLWEVDTENHRQVKANDTYYLLKRTKVPTIIVECGFLTNPEEAAALAGEEYQEEMAQAIGKGIKKCLGEK